MKITPVEIAVKDLVEKFEDNAENGVRAYSGTISERICIQ